MKDRKRSLLKMVMMVKMVMMGMISMQMVILVMIVSKDQSVGAPNPIHFICIFLTDRAQKSMKLVYFYA